MKTVNQLKKENKQLMQGCIRALNDIREIKEQSISEGHLNGYDAETELFLEKAIRNSGGKC